MDDFIFEENTHTYKVKGEKVPCFSDVIEFASRQICPKCNGGGCPYCKNKGFQSWYTEESSKRGIWIHKRCYDILRKESDADWWWWIESEYDDCLGKLHGWVKFLKFYNLYKAEYIIEQSLYSAEINTAGTPDILFPSQKIGIELKSGKFKPADKFQIAVYSHLVDWNIKQGWLKGKVVPGKWRWILVYLNNKGYDAKEYPDTMVEYLTLFRSFHATYVWNPQLIGGKHER